MAKILIIDDDIDTCQLLDRFFKKGGYDPVCFTSAKKGIDYLRENTNVDIVFSDFRLPDADGREVLQKVKALDASIPVIIITGYSDVKTSVDMMKHGAFDYITKPLLPEEILMLTESALSEKRQEKAGDEQTERIAPKERVTRTKAPFENYVVGESREAERMHNQIKLVAPTNYSVIIYGESGTGKESVAYNIHSFSERKNYPFVAVDCGALTKELAGSELFGHEKGAFTGALQSKAGQFELANGGTIFLDEIGNLSYEIQVSILRVVQERKIRRLGSGKETEIDVRILVASNERLDKAAATGRFREDLYHRFNEFSINIPPLRERKNDIMIFADFFLRNANHDLGKNILGFVDEVKKIFLEYSWPGNLREMKNVIKRAALLANKNMITLETLPQEIIFPTKYSLSGEAQQHIPSSRTMSNLPELKSVALNAEYEKILEVLREVNFNKSKAATLLNIDRKTLYNKMRNYNMQKEPYVPGPLSQEEAKE